MTNTDIQKAFRIKKCVIEYFSNHKVSKVRAKEPMPEFIKTGIFQKNTQDGLPIRDFLRELEKENLLKLIPQAEFDQKAVNKNWFFINV